MRTKLVKGRAELYAYSDEVDKRGKKRKFLVIQAKLSQTAEKKITFEKRILMICKYSQPKENSNLTEYFFLSSDQIFIN